MPTNTLSYTHYKHSPLQTISRDFFKSTLSSAALVDLLIERHFVTPADAISPRFARELVMRTLSPSTDFHAEFQEELAWSEGIFCPKLEAPSSLVESIFRAYARTELGFAALSRILATDEFEIQQGWRRSSGYITDAGIAAYGAGQWRPFRVASAGDGLDTVTPSGVLLLPDVFPAAEYYATGDTMNPLAMLHHEIMAHVLPQKEAVAAGREAELLCISYENEMLHALGLPKRRLNWGLERGTLNRTLHVATGHYYQGLVRFNEHGTLVEVDPDSDEIIGDAISMPGAAALS